MQFLLRFRSAQAKASRSILALVALAALMLSSACSAKDKNGNGSSSKGSSTKKSRRVTNEKFLSSLPPGFNLPDDTDEVGMRLLADYGAMFVARGGAVAPPTVVFADEAAVKNWQSGVQSTRTDFGGINVELQSPAMKALMEARDEARSSRLDITPRGSDSARRTYAETVKLWQSRVNPGLTHYVAEGSLTQEEADRIRALSPHDQIPEILRLEGDGLYFAKDFSKSILYSVAAPGTSQHLSMLAFDVKEFENATVRSILSRHGWFQTVSSDTPHFTFLGVKEDELHSLGLKKTTNGGRVFWIPDLD